MENKNSYILVDTWNLFLYVYTHKSKAVPLQAWSGPEGSRKLSFPDYIDNGIGWW
jgi:hypothetical protein